MENTLKTPLQLNENRTFSHLKPRVFTQEDREAVAAKRKEQQTWAEDHLKLYWLDEGWMRDLASDMGFKLAAWYYPSSETKYIKRALKHVGKDSVWFKDTFGYSIAEFVEYNPTTPVWVAQCNVLEFASYEGAKKDAIGGNT